MNKILQKYIAERSHYFRRQAEELIRKGKVSVNGKTSELGQKVAEEDVILVEGRSLQNKVSKIYIKLNKPKGYTCTNRKFKNELNVFELIEKPLLASPCQGEELSLFVVGRLDKESRGLVVLTNDGDWAQKMTHPKYEHEKEYRIKVKVQNSKLKSNILEKFIEGVDIGGGDGVVKAKKVEQIDNNIFKIILTQGKKRQIRRMFDSLGLEVIDLQRVRIGKIELGDLKEGDWGFLNKI